LAIMTQHSRDEEMLRLRRLQALGLLTANVAHDFNNLLAVITGCADNLSAAVAAGSPEAERVRDIQQATGLAAGLVRRLLSLARGESGGGEVASLSVEVGGAADLVRVVAGRAVEVALSLDEGAGAVALEREDLVHALLNLAANSRDAMPRGGTLHIATRRARPDEVPVVPRARAPWGHALLSVADDGVGMSPDVLERLSTPFFTTKGEGRGSGLGLASVRSFVAECGGSMTIRSEAGRGTRVSLYLPRAAPVA
jgi:signal transduction histidine kinase